jgi:hypothetical protein
LFSDVYGQRARDLKLRAVDWRDYNIELKKRPSPYDFPAFEHEGNESRHDRQEKSIIKIGNFSKPKFINSWI